MLGVDKTLLKPFEPFLKSKLKDTNAVEVLEESKSPKIESAIGEVLPSKRRGRPRKEEEETQEFVGERRRRFAIKKVSQIKTKPKKPS